MASPASRGVDEYRRRRAREIDQSSSCPSCQLDHRFTVQRQADIYSPAWPGAMAAPTHAHLHAPNAPANGLGSLTCRGARKALTCMTLSVMPVDRISQEKTSCLRLAELMVQPIPTHLTQQNMLSPRPCLVSLSNVFEIKSFHIPSIKYKLTTKLITNFVCKLRDEFINNNQFIIISTCVL